MPHLFAICLALLAGAHARADPTRTLRIGTSGDYAPFSVTNDSATGYRGFDIAVAEAFARDRGYTLDWVRFRWPDLAQDLQASRFDLAMSGITVRPDRSAAGRFSVPVARSGAILIYALSAFRDLAASSINDFDRAGVRIAVNRGGHLERVTRARFARATVIAIGDNAAVRMALSNHAVDGIVTDTMEAPGWLKGLSGVATFGPWTRDLKAYWLAPQRVALSRELDHWLLENEADGTLARLRRTAFGPSEHAATATPLAALLAAVDERLALMPWVAASKQAGGMALEDRARERRVITAGLRSVARAASQAGVPAPPPAVVTAFYRAQIEAAKSIQAHYPDSDPIPGKATDLNEVLRPALIRIGARMADLIVALPQSTSLNDLGVAVDDALATHNLDRNARARIARTISALITAPRQSGSSLNFLQLGRIRYACNAVE